MNSCAVARFLRALAAAYLLIGCHYTIKVLDRLDFCKIFAYRLGTLERRWIAWGFTMEQALS